MHNSKVCCIFVQHYLTTKKLAMIQKSIKKFAVENNLTVKLKQNKFIGLTLRRKEIHLVNPKQNREVITLSPCSHNRTKWDVRILGFKGKYNIGSVNSVRELNAFIDGL